jgi:hypothetical protein
LFFESSVFQGCCCCKTNVDSVLLAHIAWQLNSQAPWHDPCLCVRLSNAPQDEAIRVLRSQLEESSGRMLELEGRLASACKEARAFQHRAVDAERASSEATNSLAALTTKATALQAQLEAITTERNAFKDKVREQPVVWVGLSCAFLYFGLACGIVYV